MANLYSEDELIEKTTAGILHKDLHWLGVYAYDNEVLGSNEPINEAHANGMNEGRKVSLGRNSYKEVYLYRYLLQALKKSNPGLPEEAYQRAIEKLEEYNSSLSLADINYAKYQLLVNGIPVDYRNQKGEQVRNQHLKVFEFNNPSENHFLFVRQLWIEARNGKTFRPDVIGFVNGIPLLFIELKSTAKNLEEAYNDNLYRYRENIPQLFHCNAFVILSNGIESKIGGATSKYRYFHEWKRIIEEEEGIVSLDTILKGICDNGRFLDLFENFILYDTNTLGTPIKLIAHNHQFLGVNKAIQRFADNQQKYKQGILSKDEKQKLGVFWHTQGSGKSYSMVFFTKKIHRKFTGNYTFLVVTDRNELDNQVYSAFAGVGEVPVLQLGKKNDTSIKAGSGNHLQELLMQNHRYLFTLIHKFNFTNVITERDDIIVISDEAHRTQNGILAQNMRKVIPGASFIGFTGTPLMKGDNTTKGLFGDYVSIYDFKRSIDDKATVPLYYENRGELLRLSNPQITQQMRDAIADEDVDVDQQRKLEQLFAKQYPIITAKKRLQAIAKDIVWHFCNRGYKGKAMLVCIDKITAVKMYNHITEAWKDYIQQKEVEIKKLSDDQELLQRQQELNWIKATEIAVVISGEPEEEEKFAAYDLDIVPHRKKMNERDLETEFKDENTTFRLVIVCAMWITGFDVPTLSTLYLDKPLRAHTLMQTIARANRTADGKNNGELIDYIDAYQNLLDALAIYAVGRDDEGKVAPLRPKEELIEEAIHAIVELEKYMIDELQFDLNSILHEDPLKKLKGLKDGENAIYANDETKRRFEVMARLALGKVLAAGNDEKIELWWPKRDAIKALYERINRNKKEADISELLKKLQDIVDDSITQAEEKGNSTITNNRVVDISNLDFDLIEELYRRHHHSNTVVHELKDQIETRLQRMMSQNPTRVDFYSRYQRIIEEYNAGKDKERLESVFQQLIMMVRSMDAEEYRVKREGLTPEQGAIFDLLLKPTLTPKDKITVKKVAVELLEAIRKQGIKDETWIDKSTMTSAIRDVIQSYLFQHLPDQYDQGDVDGKTGVVFDYLCNHPRLMFDANKSAVV